MDDKPKIQAFIGQYADYLDTGIWTIKDGRLIPPDDLTDRQYKDFVRIFGELFDKNDSTI